MKRKQVLRSAIGAIIGIGISAWLLFPYDIFAGTIDGGFLRALAVFIPVVCGAFGSFITFD